MCGLKPLTIKQNGRVFTATPDYDTVEVKLKAGSQTASLTLSRDEVLKTVDSPMPFANPFSLITPKSNGAITGVTIEDKTRMVGAYYEPETTEKIEAYLRQWLAGHARDEFKSNV